MADKGTFQYDLDFLKKYDKSIIVLKKEDAEIIISPNLQGRVMTSTASGKKGKSFGWINYDLFSSGNKMEHINPYGGEERFWLGPEGGQFSIFFKPGTSFDFKNWFVPKELDTESFELVNGNISQVHFQKEMTIRNYSGTIFNLKVDRTINILSNKEISDILKIDLPDDIKAVGYKTENSVTNTGNHKWTKETGKLSIWILDMLNCSEKTTIIVPFKTGPEEKPGKIVTDDYFGKIPKERLKIKNGKIYFKADGKQRGKIGLSPQRTKNIFGSYDAVNNIITVSTFSFDENNKEYVNSLWEMQENPFDGDVVNAYNDGPLEDGSQLGPFYELENSSPALGLSPGESAKHINHTFHFEGNEESLNKLIKNLLDTSVEEVKNVF